MVLISWQVTSVLFKNSRVKAFVWDTALSFTFPKTKPKLWNLCVTNVLARGRWITAGQGTACQGEPKVRKTSPEAATVAAKALQEPRTKVQIGALASLSLRLVRGC